ncbi:MAG: DUF362 domain-containing protein [Anaerolineae bacterium]
MSESDPIHAQNKPQNGGAENQSRISRRAFLRLGLLAGIGAGAAVVYQRTADVGLGNWLRWVWRGQTARFAPPARVGIATCPSYDADILAVIRQVWRDAGIPDLAGARVVVKPNLVDFLQGHPSYTDPRMVEALLRFLRDEQHVASMVVAEGTTFRRDSEAILQDTGYVAMLDRQKVEFVDLNYDDLVKIPLRGGYARLSQLFVARTVAEADVLISVPKLKTHHWTQVSASIKNLFGIVPGIKYGWPKNTLHVQGLNEFLVELVDSLPTPRRVALVDGIVGMQGDGPLFGSGVDSRVLVAGEDYVAVDTTCARLMGFDPSSITYLTLAAWAGLGQFDAGHIEIHGASLDSVRRAFQPAPHV